MKKIPSVHGLKPNEFVRYTLAGESKILMACNLLDGGKYHRSGARHEQIRARVMVLLLRSTALRISDVASLPKDAVSWDASRQTWCIRPGTQKSSEPVFLPIPNTLKITLDGVPLPRNAAQDCRYYFWNGVTRGGLRVGIAERPLAAVFKKSGVEGPRPQVPAHAGDAFTQVTDTLGNSPAAVRKAPWEVGERPSG